MGIPSTVRWRHIGDLIAGSDPGLSRLRMAASGAGAMASALAVEYGIASLRGADSQGTLIAMLLGAIVAMMGSMALTGTGVWSKVRVAVVFPVAIAAGMVPGVLVSGHVDLMLVVFVVVMFVAVFVRRFGPAFFFYGFMAWMGYFFAAFLHATASMLPWLIADAAVGAAWVLILSVTVLRRNPRRTLAHIRRSFNARAGALAAACTDLLEAEPGDRPEPGRAHRRLQAQQTRLAEAALMIEAWSAEDDALPVGWSAQALRRRVLDIQLSFDRVAGSSRLLVDADPRLKVAAAAVTRTLARVDYPAAESAAEALHRLADRLCESDAAGWWRARHLAAAAIQHVELARQSGTPPEVDPTIEFTPAVELAMGNLPGSPAIARDVAVRGSRWNPMTRLDFTTRQAVQVAIAGALAILLGKQLDPTRYYWAVIAAFIAFTGTGTRSETFLKAGNRVLGTLVGLVAGIAFARLSAGHTGWTVAIIVASMFCGFYLVRVSYAYMIFFVTIMVAQLYSVLNEFTDQLLVLRLEETAVGAAVGVGVAVLVSPLSTRDTVASSQTNLLTALAELLDTAAGQLAARTIRVDNDLDALQRILDNRLRELEQVAAPLTRPLIWENSPREARHRLTLYAACVSASRTIAVTLRAPTPFEPELGIACGSLADAARGLAEHPGPLGVPVRDAASVQRLVAEADGALFTASSESAAPAHAAVRRALIHLHMLLQEVVAGPDPDPATVPRRSDVDAAVAR